MKRVILAILMLAATIAAAPLPPDRQLPLPCTWTGVERIVAVGDIHGDYDQMVKILRAARIIDATNAWAGGKAHLVQTGDILDRGPDSKKAMDLLMRLEKEAAAAGGRVHALIGNHEAMVPLGDLNYVHPGEYEAFGGKEELLKALGPKGTYGQWILGHNAVIRINDTLFLHGGISPRYAATPLQTINDSIRKELAGGEEVKDGILMDMDGPLWCRAYALKEEADLEKELAAVLKAFGVHRVVVGHTVSKGGVRVRCGGRVVMIDVGISHVFGGPAECLLIEGEKLSIVTPAATKSLPLSTKPAE